ncbi:glutamine synthetase family protein [Actinoplanes couchii]|uniref:glutamine synthetase n=1 Tax=Actinoplanes couchii TaxID=403638 RepID=A0ABQ3XG74_9ACTN|nr:glutamine synthetase family protein [Actinoplanes couchii]MDR6320956.1 glutamine synthetase [Actinoplanes couchii]GID57468.1 glutamine synthetase [Actinoplanes couchii]
MRSVDERLVAEGGGGWDARPMLAAERGGFIDRHGLWSNEQWAAAGQIRRVIDELGLELIRFSFADQHGILHGKTLTRASIPGALRDGVTAPSSLLLKDSSGQSVMPVFTPDAEPGFAGAGDVVMVPDPTTFRVLPWAEKTGWVLCDLRFPTGAPVPYCTRSILRGQLDRLRSAGYDMTVGVELEFHVFRDGQANQGGQLLLEEGLDDYDEVVQLLQRGLRSLDLPLRSIELEFGAGQLEITLQAGSAAESADHVTLLRSAIRQMCRRQGYHATFMSRPHGTASASTGWHLHQSLRERATGRAAFEPGADETLMSSTARHWLGGLLAHAPAAAAFSTPTVNGYKRYLPFSLAPDRVLWGADNKGAMVRAVSGRLENRSGEPAANPYLYVASQVISGLDGLAGALDPGPPTESPYATDAVRLPQSLGEAVTALEADRVFAEALGQKTIDWYARIKRDEFARYLAHVSDWEQREYFDLF